MSILRSRLIRLAHENPELRSELLPLLREASNGEKPEGVGTVKDPLVPKVFDELFDALGASSLKWDAVFRRSEINIPENLSGVFAEMWFDVAWKKGWGAGNVSLKWNHTNGGSNGYTLGTFYYDAEKDCWEWRTDSGKRGIISRGWAP